MALSPATCPLRHGSGHRFGDWRTEPTAGLTDKGYTGHPSTLLRTGKHNNLGGGANDLGLIYMNARYYIPALARFASADTIVPDPANPQAYNRFSYVNNNSLSFTDPSGHCAQEDSSCWEYQTKYQKEYGVVITGVWALDEMKALGRALSDLKAGVGFKSLRAFYKGLEIRRKQYYQGNPDNITTYGFTEDKGARYVEIYDPAFEAGIEFGHFTLLHEFGHVYDIKQKGIPSQYFSTNTRRKFSPEDKLDESLYRHLPPEQQILFQLAFSGTPHGEVYSLNNYKQATEDFAETFAQALYTGDRNKLHTQMNSNPFDIDVSLKVIDPNGSRLQFMRELLNLGPYGTFYKKK